MKEKLTLFVALFLILFTTLFLQLSKIEPFESFSLHFNDINFKLQDQKPNKDIVFVAVDEPSVNKFGRWPWRREIIAKGISKLSEADVVLMDMIFSEPTSKKADGELAASIDGLNASVCGFFLRHNSTQSVTSQEVDLLDDSSLDLLQSQISKYKSPLFISAPYAEINVVPILQSCTLSGSFSTLTESDSLLRSYPIGVYYKNKLFPSLAIQALRIKFDKDIKRVNKNTVSLNGTNIHLNDKGFVRLNFYKREQYNIVSFLDVIENKVPPQYFKNKIVILGITEVGSGDVVSTPIGSLFGPLLHYTFLSNFLQHQLIIEPKNINTIIMILLVLLPFILIMSFKKVTTRLIINIAAYISTYFIVRYLFVSEMIYIDLFYPLIGILLSSIVLEALTFVRQEKNSRFLKDAFSAYLSADLLAQLVNNPKALSLGGKNKHMSILFSDIRGFTTISESMDAASLVKLLNRYFTPMTDSVLENMGMLDKYIGDAVMAFFNAPVDVNEHAKKACLCALDMIHRLEKLNTELDKENIPAIHIGIGINTANVVVGNIGSDSRFNYTIMGDGVNLTSRVEGLTKNYGVDILITEFTLKELDDSFIIRRIEPVIVKGKDEAVFLYELMPQTQQAKEIKEMYDKALDFYISNDVAQASPLFKQLVDSYDDGVSKYFLESINVSKPWGVCRMTSK